MSTSGFTVSKVMIEDISSPKLVMRIINPTPNPLPKSFGEGERL